MPVSRGYMRAQYPLLMAPWISTSLDQSRGMTFLHDFRVIAPFCCGLYPPRRRPLPLASAFCMNAIDETSGHVPDLHVYPVEIQRHAQS